MPYRRSKLQGRGENAQVYGQRSKASGYIEKKTCIKYLRWSTKRNSSCFRRLETLYYGQKAANFDASHRFAELRNR